ncbi:MAG: PHP domain-containing protein [Kiritimatiellaeota bacterium]|nr:PHP domain-containing protein [Kiritimatiellota bacterium]
MIDLHTHSTASDGTLSPAGIVHRAAQAGLSAVALTDHDTTAGIEEFMEAARGGPVRAIPGVEIACRWYGANLHLVGLFIDPACPVLQELLARVRHARTERNLKVLDILAELGCPLEPCDIAPEEPLAAVGRPHVARALVRRGHCQSVSQAFARFLKRGKPAYVRRELPLPSECVAAIHAAGGVAVWAHPMTTRGPAAARARRPLRHLFGHGLDGLEVCYVDYSPRQEAAARKLLEEFGLLPSGGSDFHGDNIPGVRIGTGRDNLAIPDTWVEPLEQRAEGFRTETA